MRRLPCTRLYRRGPEANSKAKLLMLGVSKWSTERGSIGVTLDAVSAGRIKDCQKEHSQSCSFSSGPSTLHSARSCHSYPCCETACFERAVN